MKSTKRALFSSIMALILCFSMLVGTTFAWFTDEVTSGTNQIIAGNLDIELEYKKVVNGVISDWTKVQDQADIFDPNALWEPGRVEVVYLKVSNLGTLALKYQLGVNVAEEIPGINVNGDPFKLSDYLVFKVIEIDEANVGFYTRANAVDANDTIGLKDYNGSTKSLDPKDGSNDEDYLALIVYMPETVGNIANYKSGTTAPEIKLGINLLATQVDAEFDSFGNDYDQNASYPANYVIKETVAVTTDATTNAVVTNEEKKLEAKDDSSVVSSVAVTVPQGAAVNAADATAPVELAAKVTSAEDVQAGVKVYDNQSAIALNINVEGLAANNDKIVTVTLKIAAGLTDLAVYHKGDRMTELASATTAAEGYHYDSATGMLTIKSKTFSPFDVVFGVPAVKTLEELKAAVALGGNVKLGADITSDEILVINKAITLDGNGYTLTYTGEGVDARAINVSGANGVTIKNLTIKAEKAERAINIIQKATNVTLDNVTATADNYTVNVATSAPNAVVTIKNSTLDGLCTVNVAGAGAKVTVDNSTINCNDNNTTEGESYAALSLNKEATGGSIVATNTTVNVTEGSDSFKGRNGAENGTVTINGSTDGIFVAVAVITYEGSPYYYSFASLADAIEFAKDGDTITLIRDIVLTESVEIPEGKNIVLNLNGKNITIETAYDDAQPSANSAIVNDGSVVLTGNGTIKATNNYTVRNYGTMVVDGITVENGIMNFADLTVESGNISNSRSGKHAIYGNAAKLTINGGTFHNGNPGNATIFSYAGEVVLNGGEFTIADGTATLGWTSCLLDAQGNAKFTINGGVVNGEIRDYNKNTAVYGGTFAHKSALSFVADGYQSIDNGNGTWTVLKGDVLVKNSEELAAAVAAGHDEIVLANGEYTMPDGTDVNLQGKELTIVGTKDTVIDVSAVDARDQFVTGATLVFDGVTLNFGKVNYMGFANTASLTYKNCQINGLQFLFGEKVTFENCVLNSNDAEHCVWTYGAKNVSFTNCEFTYGDRGINCYSDNDIAGGKQTVNFTNCTFTTANTASEGAVEINSCFFSVGIEVNMNGCTAPAYGQMAYVSRWDSTNGAKTTINIK